MGFNSWLLHQNQDRVFVCRKQLFWKCVCVCVCEWQESSFSFGQQGSRHRLTAWYANGRQVCTEVAFKTLQTVLTGWEDKLCVSVCLCLCVCVFLTICEDHFAQRPYRLRTFLESEDILAGPPFFKGLLGVKVLVRVRHSVVMVKGKGLNAICQWVSSIPYIYKNVCVHVCVCPNVSIGQKLNSLIFSIFTHWKTS